jgi:hypothetical protein
LAPGGDHQIRKDLLTAPRDHARRFKGGTPSPRRDATAERQARGAMVLYDVPSRRSRRIRQVGQEIGRRDD